MQIECPKNYTNVRMRCPSCLLVAILTRPGCIDSAVECPICSSVMHEDESVLP
jgi:hypothetical protein